MAPPLFSQQQEHGRKGRRNKIEYALEKQRHILHEEQPTWCCDVESRRCNYDTDQKNRLIPLMVE